MASAHAHKLDWLNLAALCINSWRQLQSQEQAAHCHLLNQLILSARLLVVLSLKMNQHQLAFELLFGRERSDISTADQCRPLSIHTDLGRFWRLSLKLTVPELSLQEQSSRLQRHRQQQQQQQQY